jgi:phosphohistidine swiveling domain-containing protein
VLVTDELYPEIGSILDRLRGIVAESGGFGSHLAILARERRVPMRIQAAGARVRYGGATQR